MTISQVIALPVGNALQVFLQPPAAAEFWRVLRKPSDDFTGFDDAGAIVVHDGTEKELIDDRSVINGIPYFYRAFYWTGAAWEPSASATGTAAATYADRSVEAFDIVRSRLEAGLAVEVARGVLKHNAGGIPVLSAPPVFDDTRWPVVTVHLQNEAPSTRFLGEMLAGDVFDTEAGKFVESEGWLANVSLTVIGWSLNPDERATLRKALRRVVLANLPVFNAHGMVNVEFGMQDVEDFESYNAPVYQAMCSLSCQAPVLVSDEVDPITDVVVSADDVPHIPNP